MMSDEIALSGFGRLKTELPEKDPSNGSKRKALEIKGFSFF